VLTCALDHLYVLWRLGSGILLDSAVPIINIGIPSPTKEREENGHRAIDVLCHAGSWKQVD
jgi:hypothetical protein